MATITVEINSTDETVLKNDIANIDTWVQDAVTGKINNCWKRMQKEWTDKLMNDDTFTDPIPSRYPTTFRFTKIKYKTIIIITIIPNFQS